MAPSGCLRPGGLPLAVRGRELVVALGGSEGATEADAAARHTPLLSGLDPKLTFREEQGGSVIVGLDLERGHLPGIGGAARPVALADVAVGQLHNCRRFLALSKTSLWWMSPRWGDTPAQVPVETQFLLLDLQLPQQPQQQQQQQPEQAASRTASHEAAQAGGSQDVFRPEAGSADSSRPATAGYLLMLPLIDSGRFRATLRPPKGRIHNKHSLVLRLESGSPTVTGSCWPSALLLAAGRDPYELIAHGVAATARLSGIARPRCEKAVPSSVGVFGWCTWDAFYSMVSAAGISEGLRSLARGGTPPRLLIIDDGWQQTDVDPQYRQMAAQRHLVGQVSVPHTQSELELEDAVMDLVMGPSDERETNTRHTINKEEEQILMFTPRALTPHKAAMPPFARTPPRPGGLLSAGLLSPRLRLGPAGVLSPLRPARQLPRPASAAAVLMRDPAEQAAADTAGRGSTADAGAEGAAAAAAPSPLAAGPAASKPGALLEASPLRPLLSLAPIAAPRPTPADSAEGLTASPLALVGAVAAEPAVPGPLEEGQEAAVVEEAATQAAEAGLNQTLWDRLQHAEAQALRLLKSWLDVAPSDSWRFRAFSAAATGPLLRPTLLRFYARATEHTRRLAGIEANAKFGGPVAGPDSGDLNSTAPEGCLSQVVSHFKVQFGVTHVYLWHALMGFWAGVAPKGTGSNGTATDKYAVRVVIPRPTPGTLEIDPSYAWTQATLAGVGLPASPRQLHTDMHEYLQGCGVDGVKVDVQGMVAHVGTATEVGGPALAAAYHASLEDSAARCFQSAVMNCMCLSTENLYNMRDTNLGRCSDDFYPRNRASFTTHISTCAFNSLFCGEIFIPDWDMFHSRHSAALLHATARAISGGPIYISDKPGQHDFDLLRRLVLPDGSVLRCLLPGRPTPDCLFHDVNGDGKSALKVWNMNQCGGALAAFNVQGASWSTPRRGFHFYDFTPTAITAHVCPTDVPGLVPLAGRGADGLEGGSTGAATSFAVYVDSRKELVLLGPRESLPLELAPGGGSEMLTLAAVQEAPQGGVRFAPIGLTNMLNAGGAVLSCTWEDSPSKPSSGRAGGDSGDSGSPRAGTAAQSPRGAAATATRGQAVRLCTRGHGELLAYCSAMPAAVEVFTSGSSGGAAHDASGDAGSGGGVRFAFDPLRSALRWEVLPGLPLELGWVVRFP